jgi:hypothetical protein
MSEWLSNRDKAREPRGRASWCNCCDANKVAAGAKCGVCGVRMPGKRSKAGKPSPSPEPPADSGREG